MPYKLDTNTAVYVYEAEFYPLSNFSAFRLRWKANDFDTSEHAYHWEKFATVPLAQGHIQQRIVSARSAHEAFKIAAAARHLQRADWPAVRVDIMREMLRAKAQQHEYVRRKLLETGDREIIEDSWRDPFWGWGSDKTGQNMLGQLWMEIRGQIRRQVL